MPALVARIDPVRHAVEATIPVGTRPARVVAAGGQVWVLDRTDRTLARIDPQTDTVAQTIAPASQPSDILLSAGSLWVASRGDGRVLRIDPGTGRTRSVVPHRREPEWPGRRGRRGLGGDRQLGSARIGSTPGPAR